MKRVGEGAERPSRRGPSGRGLREISIGALLLLLGATIGGAAPDDGPSLPDDPLSGRLLFESKGCSHCHGIAGSAPSVGPSLGERRFEGSFLELGASLWNHVPGMSVALESAGLPWPELTQREVTELISFFYFIDYLGRPGDAAAGEQVFKTQGCAFCHEIGRGETGLGPDLAVLRRFASPIFVAREIWNHGPSMLESMRELRMPAPSFGEGDLADLSAFIRRRSEIGPHERLLAAPGNPNRGREVFQSQGCSKCHGASGRDGEWGPNLGESDLHRSAEAIAGTMWNHALVMRDSMRELGVGWPEFAEGELADLIAFLYFLPFADPPGSPSLGAEVFENRTCSDCHTGSELAPEATRQGPDLVGTDAAASPDRLIAAMWNHAPVMKRIILGEGLAWPELTGAELRDVRSFLLENHAPTDEP